MPIYGNNKIKQVTAHKLFNNWQYLLFLTTNSAAIPAFLQLTKFYFQTAISIQFPKSVEKKCSEDVYMDK